MKIMITILLFLALGLNSSQQTGPNGFVAEEENNRPENFDQAALQNRVTIVSSLPIECSFASGSRLVFKMPPLGVCHITLKNMTTQPATITLSVHLKTGDAGRNSKKPVSHKTATLNGGESSSLMLPGTAGDKVVLEVHKGKMRIEVCKDKPHLVDNL